MTGSYSISATRDGYIAALRSSAYVEGPTEEQLLALCPHLTRDQVIDGFYGDRVLALPPLKVRGALRIGRLQKASVGYKSILQGGSIVRRTTRSYADGTLRPLDDDYTALPFLHEAMAYAEAYWPEQLVTDDWADHLWILLQDPMDYSVKGLVSMTLNRPLEDIMRDASRPEVELLNDAVIDVCLDPIIGSERAGGRSGNYYRNCVRCGSALNTASCRICSVESGATYDNGWTIPLPQKVFDALKGQDYFGNRA